MFPFIFNFSVFPLIEVDSVLNLWILTWLQRQNYYFYWDKFYFFPISLHSAWKSDEE